MSDEQMSEFPALVMRYSSKVRNQQIQKNEEIKYVT